MSKNQSKEALYINNKNAEILISNETISKIDKAMIILIISFTSTKNIFNASI